MVKFINCSQIGFIDFLVTPLYDAWSTFSKTDYTTRCLTNIANNRSQWQANAENPNVLDGVPPTDFEKLDTLLDLTIPQISFGSRPLDRRSSIPRRYTYSAQQANLDIDLKRISESISNVDLTASPPQQQPNGATTGNSTLKA
jgi:hypothetical protein